MSDNCSTGDATQSHISFATARFAKLATEARNQAPKSLVSVHRPLLGFYGPKTSGDTHSHFLHAALALRRQASHPGCYPGRWRPSCAPTSDENSHQSHTLVGYQRNVDDQLDARTRCMAFGACARRASCSVAFGNHFRPLQLVKALAVANAKPNAKCRRVHWPSLRVTDELTQAQLHTALQRSVCTVVLQDPAERAISDFYQWHFQRTTNLTAPEYLDAHGIVAFLNIARRGQATWTEERWPALFKSCIIGTTEKYEHFLETLSRVIHMPTSPQGLEFRSREKVGFSSSDWPRFYSELGPHMAREFAIWRLAKCVAAAQHEAALPFAKLMRDDDASDLLNSEKCRSCETAPRDRLSADRPSTFTQCRAPPRAVGRQSVCHPPPDPNREVLAELSIESPTDLADDFWKLSEVSLSTSLMPTPFASPMLSTTVVSPLRNGSSCRLYVLLSAQRSGSTWLCEQLGAQPGITCGPNGDELRSEMLIKYSYMGNGCCHRFKCAQGQPCNHTDPPPLSYGDWNAYRADLDVALNEAQASNRCGRAGGSAATGFKLMYDQVPRAFITSGNLTRYLAERGVSVLHLVREATLLRVASSMQDGGMHTKTMMMAQRAQASQKLRWQGRKQAWPGTGPFGGTKAGVHRRVHLTTAVKLLEAVDSDWKRVMAFQTPGVRYHYVAYEHLLTAAGYDDHMQRISFFLLGGSSAATRGPARRARDSLRMLHAPTCESRIDEFDSLRKAIEYWWGVDNGSRSTSMAACDFLTSLSRESR